MKIDVQKNNLRVKFFYKLFISFFNSQDPDGAHLHTTHADQIFDQS